MHTSSNLDETHINGADWNPYTVFQIMSDARNDSGFNINGLTNTEVLPRHLYTLKGALPRIGLNVPIPAAMLHLSASSANSASIRLDNNVGHIDLRLHEKIAHITGSYDKLDISGSVEMGQLSTTGIVNTGELIQSGSITMSSGSRFTFDNPGLSEIRSKTDSLILSAQGALGGTIIVSGSFQSTGEIRSLTDVIAPGYILSGVPSTTLNTIYQSGDDLFWNGSRVLTDTISSQTNQRIESTTNLSIVTPINKNISFDTQFITSSRHLVSFDTVLGLKQFTSSADIASYPTSSLLGGEMCVLVNQGSSTEEDVANKPWLPQEQGSELSTTNINSSGNSVVKVYWNRRLNAVPSQFTGEIVLNMDQFVFPNGSVVRVQNEDMLVVSNDQARVTQDIVRGTYFNQLTLKRGHNSTTIQDHTGTFETDDLAITIPSTSGLRAITGSITVTSLTATEQPYMYSKFQNKWLEIATGSNSITSTAT